MKKKGGVDPLTEQTLSRINNSLDEYKSRLDEVEASIRRPNSNSNLFSQEDNKHKSAFIQYLKKGRESALLDLEKKSLSSSSDADGGFLVEKNISKQITKRIETNSVMRQLASIETISTDLLDILGDTDTAAAGWVAETEVRKEASAPTLQKKFIRVHEIYAQPHATQKLIDDARIDIEKWITEKIADKFASLENQAFISGDGHNKPRGILLGGSDAIINSNSTSIAVEDIINLYYSLPSKYSANATFLMHRNTLQQLRGLKCPTSGRYLWSPGIALKESSTLLGAPIVECSDISPLTPGSLPIVFADFKEGYKIVDRAGIRMLRDPFTEKPFVKFYATKRVGGDIINNDAIKILKITSE